MTFTAAVAGERAIGFSIYYYVIDEERKQIERDLGMLG